MTQVLPKFLFEPRKAVEYYSIVFNTAALISFLGKNAEVGAYCAELDHCLRQAALTKQLKYA